MGAAALPAQNGEGARWLRPIQRKRVARRPEDAPYTPRPVTSVAPRLPRPAVRRRLRAVPVALWILLAIAAVHGSAWAFITAPMNAPDGTSHVAYVQSLVET